MPRSPTLILQGEDPPRSFRDVLAVRVDHHDDTCVVALHGELDMSTVEKAERALALAMASDTEQIVLDLSGLSFIGTTGIRLVQDAHARSLVNSSRLRLVRAPARLHRIFELCGLANHLPFETE